MSSAVDTGKVCNGGVYLNSALTSPQNYMEDPNGDRTYFTVDQVDWTSAPEIIKKIVYTPIPQYPMVYDDSTGYYEIDPNYNLKTHPSPFVLVRQSDIDEFMVFAGYNVAVGLRGPANNFTTFDGLGFCGNRDYNPVLYRALFSDGVWSDFTTLSPSIDNGRVYFSMYGSSGLNNHLDWYFYGTNMFMNSNLQIQAIQVSYGVSSTKFVNVYMNYQGALTRLFPSSDTPNYFCSLFTPLTAEQQSQQTQKGIFAKIQELIQKVGNWFVDLRMSITNGLNTLKDNLINGIRSLFVPSDGYFDQLKEDFSDWMEDHFGVLYQSGSLIVDIMEQIRDFDPQESNYPLTFPAIYGSEVVNGEVVNTEMSSEHEYALGDILVQEPFDGLYDVYLTCVSAVFYLSLVFLAWRKFHKFLEGR